MWVPPEQRDPIVLHAPTRKSVACFGAVSVGTGKLVTLFEPKFNGESFQRFLQLLLRHPPRVRIVVASPKESFIRIGGSEVTRNGEVFEGEEAARFSVDVAA